jgi:hypothetical protein
VNWSRMRPLCTSSVMPWSFHHKLREIASLRSQ